MKILVDKPLVFFIQFFLLIHLLFNILPISYY
ncbi:hypothetical protein APJL_1121 [Actinobacillus pleuropneumoniae serovar 3 str. JL03]|uniref:Uncharacterized protein n=1 Tax=Actinobacillus pleuropneumoniae serotype 3 (strain JL03) TaxID=434271 RepID=B0BQ42_ACTPJ|nr:hypothetical protein APJL_1121 [Actinobacillus pleuropneumoniae serovar 3 str. JL03]